MSAAALLSPAPFICVAARGKKRNQRVVTQHNEKTILERIASGDPGAVKDCITTYGDLVWSLARRFLRNDADAEDAVQEIFIDLWGSAARFDRKVAGEVAFVATIARRRLIDRLRQKDRKPGMDSLDNEDFAEANRPSVMAMLEEDADVAVVERVLQSLPPEQREILALSLHEGYSHSEIADRLNIPLGTVKTRVRRGLIYVRERLGIRVESAEEAASS